MILFAFSKSYVTIHSIISSMIQEILNYIISLDYSDSWSAWKYHFIQIFWQSMPS